MLVIGAGINGACIAYDAALRGLTVLLVDKKDFGGETSSGCFKIIHGGQRYLQHLNFKRLYESAMEQQVLRFIAPHLVRPFSFLVPCYGFGMKGKELLRLGFWLYQQITRNKNKGLSKELHIPKTKILSKSEVEEAFPTLPKKNLRGGVLYSDCQISNCERLTLSFVLGAKELGATVLNYVQAEKFSFSADAIEEVTLKDCLTEKLITVKPKVVVNAAGPWIDEIWKNKAETQYAHHGVYSKGVQLVVSKKLSSFAVAIESSHKDTGASFSRGGRSYFVVPWREHSLVGTADVVYKGEPNNFSISETEIKDFLEEVNSAFTSPWLKRSDVTWSFGGLRPMSEESLNEMNQGREINASTIGASRKDKVIDLEVENKTLANAITMRGVKYTTSRRLAVKAVDLACEKLKKAKANSVSHVVRLPGGDFDELEKLKSEIKAKFQITLSEQTLNHLLSNYGTLTNSILKLIKETPELGNKLSGSDTYLQAEVVYVVREEMVHTLSDVVFRRCGMGTLGYPDKSLIEEVSHIIKRELHWSEERRLLEIENLDRDFLKNLSGLVTT